MFISNPTVVDVFCGAGGFSEGFRQQGFHIIKGYDNSGPAIETYNHNFHLNLETKNVLDFQSSVEEIHAIPDTTVILGSPPCVSFSNSNKSGKADKSMGLKLTEAFLRIVAVKKFKSESILKAWFMENVPNSLKYIKEQYTFRDLDLSEWALSIGKKPEEIAIKIAGNSKVINSADYGSPQVRKRAITGEIISKRGIVIPFPTHCTPKKKSDLPGYRTLSEIRAALPSPFSYRPKKLVTDPSYDIAIPHAQLSDQFYDTGLFECEWKNSQFLKVNHPYMGRMSFPEKESSPSRTICATNIGTSRESIIYKSEFSRVGNGEYRTHTVREAATLMGFPITYQFCGAETSKLRLVGNAVCPSVSRAFAKIVRKELGLQRIINPNVCKEANLEGVNNLNSPLIKSFETPPRKNKGSRFRRHPFKYGNITVTLSNYDITNKGSATNWITSVQYGNGDGYPSENYPDNFFEQLENVIADFEQGTKFIETINNGFSERIANGKTLQEMYETRRTQQSLLQPTDLIEEVASIIDGFTFKDPDFKQNGSVFFNHKAVVPKKQVMALYAINKISSIANK